MKVKHTVSLAEATNALNVFKNMSSKDKLRFAQCFNCKNLDTCTRDEKDEDENGMCKFYDELPKSNRPQSSFIDVFNREIQKIVKEDNDA